MADFSIRETQLAAPQGAGTGAVQAVQEQPSGILEKVTTVGKILAQGFEASQKAEAEKRKQTIVNQYIQSEAAINDAISGGMSASEASVRSRANFNKFAANHGEYIDEFNKAANALKGHTNVGVAVDEVKAAEAQRTKDIDLARDRGIIIPVGTSRENEVIYTNAAKKSVATEKQLAEHYKAQAEYRASSSFDSAVAEKKDKEFALQIVNEIGATHLTTFQTTVQTIADNVRDGKMNQADALQELNRHYSNIKAGLAAASRGNPELANLYASTFQSIYEIGVKVADPKMEREDYKSKVADLIARTQYSAIVENPSLRGYVSLSQLLGNNVPLSMASSKATRESLAWLENLPLNTNQNVPQVIGNPEVEKEVFKLLRKGLSDITGGKSADVTLATKQATNSVNQLLAQMGDEIDKRGATPDKLVNSAAFLASPEYRDFAMSGKLDPKAAQAAEKVFQLMYTPAVTNGIRAKLESFAGQGMSSWMANKEKTVLGDLVDIKFNGSGIAFTAKETTGLDRAERSSRDDAVKELQASQAGINQLIHISAHLAQTKDYRKVWEDQKHVWLPSIYPDPAKLAVGQTITAKNGKKYKYLGGNFNDITGSYVEVPSGKSE